MTFQLTSTWYYLEAYRLLSSSQRLLYPSQRNYYRKSSLEHRVKITYTILLLFPEVNNSSRDFSIDTNLILFSSLPSSQFISTASAPIPTHLLSKKYSWTSCIRVFLSPQKPTFTIFNSILECRSILNEFLWTLGAPWVNKLHLHLHLNLHLQWKESSSQSKFWLQTWSVRSVWLNYIGKLIWHFFLPT